MLRLFLNVVGHSWVWLWHLKSPLKPDTEKDKNRDTVFLLKFTSLMSNLQCFNVYLKFIKFSLYMTTTN